VSRYQDDVNKDQSGGFLVGLLVGFFLGVLGCVQWLVIAGKLK
jgi:hypothetical protein